MYGEYDTEYSQRICGGLFVKRAGNYYDFSHRSFEEYFTAQYLLRQIELNQQRGIQDFVERVVHNYSLWREPYLLAVASKSENDSTTGGTTASKLIEALFQSPLTSTDLNLLLLTATAIIEAEPNSIDLTLQRQIADAFIQRYTEALRTKKFEHCKRIEQTMTRWLLTLPKDAFRPPVLLSLLDHILNAPQKELRATLKLLAMVMPDILTGSPQIFNTLMPVLLAIAGLPAVIGNERTVEPASNISMSSDLLVRDYAFTVLSVMGRRGPGGLLLSKIREEVEPYLEQLAYYSMDCGTLITPTNIPFIEENYVRYEAAISAWIQLQNELEKRPRTGADVKRCAAIHKALLEHAEEMNYATAPMIASMLAASAHSSELWKKIWTNMLLNQLQAQQDIAYFNAALLWTALFIERDALKQLAEQLKQDYRKTSKRISAARFIAYLAENFRYFRYFRYFRDLQGFLFTNEIVQISSQLLKQASLDEQVDLLLILLGRILQIGEGAPDTSPEQKTQQEIHYIVQQITPFCTSTNDDVREAALDILRFLPVHTEQEIRFVVEGAEQAKDRKVRDAYCFALRYARPLNSAWDVLERMGKQSQIKAVREAAEKALMRRR